jgi:hypothetical protein
MVDDGDNVSDKDRYNRFSEDWRYHHRLIWEIPSVAAAIFVGIVTVSYVYLDLLLRVMTLVAGTVLIFALAFAVRKHRFGADLRTNFLYDIAADKERFPILSSKGSDHLRKSEQEEYDRETALETWKKVEKIPENKVDRNKVRSGTLKELQEFANSVDIRKWNQKLMDLLKFMWLTRHFRKPKKPNRRIAISWSAEVNLIRFMYFIAALLLFLCIFEGILTANRINVLIGEEISGIEILINVTASNPEVKEVIETIIPP